MGGKIIELDAEGLNEVMGGEKLVVVEFFSRTCPNCQSMAPVFSKIAAELGAEAVFGTVDVQEHTSHAFTFAVMSVPTFMFFCRGRPVSSVVGALNETLLRNAIRDALAHREECVTRSTPVSYDMDGYA